jgi:hypothetical protein
MRLTPRFTSLLVASVFLMLTAACQTPNRGTSTLTSPEETSDDASSTDQTTLRHDQGQQGQIKHNKTPQHPGLEQNTTRPGSDYREVALDTPDPVACQNMCNAQMRCMAFTYVGPTDRDGPVCRLKHSIPNQVANQDCCISGVNPRAQRRLDQLAAQGFELRTDRPGADFRSFEMDRPEPSICQEACQNLKECEAFTYVRPGPNGETPQCKLKTMASEKVTDQDCCISGVK